MTIQCNGYPTPPMGERGRAKMMILEELIKEAELDMLLTQEENRDWSRVEDRDKPKYKFGRKGIVANTISKKLYTIEYTYKEEQ